MAMKIGDIIRLGVGDVIRLSGSSTYEMFYKVDHVTLDAETKEVLVGLGSLEPPFTCSTVPASSLLTESWTVWEKAPKKDASLERFKFL